MTTNRALRSAFLALLALVLLASLASCRNPSSSSQDSGTEEGQGRLRLTFGAAGGAVQRTIVPGIVAQVSKVTVRLTDSSGTSLPERSGSGPRGSIDFVGIAAGTWTIDASAYDSGGTRIASGTTTATLAANASVTLPLNLVFTANGAVSTQGDLDISLSWDYLATGVDYLSWTLDGVAMGDPSIGASGNSRSARLQASGLTAGAGHPLVVTFKKGGISGIFAGYLVEVVDVARGLPSDSWIDGTGTLRASPIALDPNFFFSSNARLQGVAFTGLGLTAAFAPATTTYYFANEPGGFSLALTPGTAGQEISADWGGTPIALTKNPDGTLSAAGLAFDTAAGSTSTNKLVITVTAPDRSAQTVYAFRDRTIHGAAAFADIANDLSGSYTLAADISTSVTTAIGSVASPFTGTLDGQGHSITMAISGSADYSGLFAVIGGTGTVKDLKLSGNVTGGSYAGAVAGKNCGTITGCTSSATVSGSHHVGGISGWNTGSIAYCSTSGDVVSSDSIGNGYSGGLVGRMDSGSLFRCYSTSNVTAISQACGGLVGYIYPGTIDQCFATGSITITGIGSIGYAGAGGLVGSIGFSVLVTNSYARGSVTGDSFVGGFTGLNCASVSNCYATGSYTANSNGNYFAYNYSAVGATITNCWDPHAGDVYYLATLATAVPSGWDTGIWGQSPSINGGYPYLRYFLDNTTVYD
jgi:hypothetical protein